MGNVSLCHRNFKKRMVKFAHQGHQGIVRTKQLLSAHVWFPGMDAMVEMWGNARVARQPLVVTLEGPS